MKSDKLLTTRYGAVSVEKIKMSRAFLTSRKERYRKERELLDRILRLEVDKDALKLRFETKVEARAMAAYVSAHLGSPSTHIGKRATKEGWKAVTSTKAVVDGDTHGACDLIIGRVTRG